MRISSVSAVLLVALLTAATGSACRKFEVRSHRAEGVPSGLLGLWEGEWQSDGTPSRGRIEVRVRQFDGDPIVSIGFDQSCIPPQSYELALVGGAIELRAGGQTVLRAELQVDGSMLGSYRCPLDAGSWSAVRTAALSPVPDLSGDWVGTLDTATQGREAIELSLTQRAVGGRLELQGLAAFPERLPAPLPVIGSLGVREGGFDIVLDTASGILPGVQMAGIGEGSPVAVQGLMQAWGGLIPSRGVWQVQRP